MVENESKKQTYARKYQEQLYRKYKNKVTSLEETKNHLERIIITPSSPLSLSPDLPSDLKMSRISLDRGRHSIDDVGSVSSSSSLPDTDGNRISGSATPRSAHSTTSLEEVNAGPTRQYSIRRENGGPVIQQSQRPPSPHSSTSESGSSHKGPPRRDRPPPVQERTSSLTTTLSRRTSQPLLSLPDGNVTLRPARKTYGDSGSSTLTRGPIKVEHPASTIKTFSSAEIESRYCSSRTTMSRGYSADPAFNNQNTNNHYYYGDSSGQYMHPGYGAMPRAPTEFDALSEMSFGSEANVNNIQSRKHIRQLLHEHFTRETNRPNDSTNPASSHYHNAPHATYQRTGNSRNHRPLNNHSSSNQEAAFTEHNHREMHVGSITPGTKKRLPPSTLSLHSTQTNMDLGTPGTPSSLASSSGILDSRTLSQNTFHRHDSGISTLSAQTHSTKTLSSQHSGGSLGYGVSDSGTEAAKRREILPGLIVSSFSIFLLLKFKRLRKRLAFAIMSAALCKAKFTISNQKLTKYLTETRFYLTTTRFRETQSR
ncbi:unnamed protein product [Oikopleura dioica]|uniref:Uncharacterized protein n=1 Tax=Oikopleura dioica TaxID=34765 RepID=E4XQG0_OIKDI|nr:unnamed protein product [Oikopleura dioica]